MASGLDDRASLRIGTRGSALALVQANLVRDALEAAGVRASLVAITTEGDQRAPDTPWGEGAFVSAIEAALLDGTVDVAVHSAKDVPTDEDPRLAIAAYLPRAVPTDVVVLPRDRAGTSLADLPLGARVGTDSPRRTAFLRAARPDLRLHPLHGNVDTRLRRLDEGRSDALVLAAAGLTRLGRADRISFELDAETVPPAPGQGAIAVQVRASDRRASDLLRRLDDRATRSAVEAERALLAASGGGCRAPIGAVAVETDGELELLAGFARPDGLVKAIARRTGSVGDPALVARVLGDLASAAAQSALTLPVPRVIVTRAADQTAALTLCLVERGMAPLSVPAVAIGPGEDGLARELGRLHEYDWVVVTSTNAVRALGPASVAPSPDVRPPRFAAVGVATSQALRSAGYVVDLRPSRSSAVALADALPIEPGARVLVPRSDIADVDLIDRLEARGAMVRSVIAYRTIEAPDSSRPGLAAALRAAPRAVVLTSGSTVRGLLGLAASIDRVPATLAIPAVCIGSGTAATARSLGFTVAAEARTQSAMDVADAAARYLLPNEEKE